MTINDDLQRRAFKRHLRGWLSYAFASEVFVIVSLTLFLPICLEQFARDNGYLLPERTTPCTSAPAAPDSDPGLRCVVKLGWVWIDTASFSLYVYSASVAIQALTVISMGGIADHPPHRKPLLLTFAFLGASAATLFLALPSSSPLWPLAALLAVIANTGFGASIVALNAYLPSLARASPEVVKLYEVPDDAVHDHNDAAASSLEFDADVSAPLLQHPSVSLPASASATAATPSAPPSVYDVALSAATARISAHGIALGYGAGITLLLVALVPVTVLHGSTMSLRVAVGMSGVWWAAGSGLGAAWLPSAEVGVLEEREIERENETNHERRGEGEGKWSVWREVGAAWRRLGGMLRWREIKQLRNTFRYLFAWFILSDAFTTMTSTAILFAKTSLHMPPSSLILIGVLTPVAGILGALAWPCVQRARGWSALRVLGVLVGMVGLVPAYGCLGFLPIFRGEGAWRVGGLRTEGEMYVLAVYFGSVYGAFQSYARAFYAELIPPGEEARWYALFSITDKSSSFLGPLLVGLIADTTGDIRYAFFFLAGMIGLALPVLAGVNVERGRADARGYRYR